MDETDSFLAAVDEFVDDEGKIVTYKWLSQQLAISAQKSKEILQTYVESCRKRENEIHIVYLIIGRNSAGMCIKVVRDAELESAKSKLNSVTSVSIYSVQKAELQNSTTLYSADIDGTPKNLSENAKLGGIAYNGAARLSKNEIKTEKQPHGGTKDDISGLNQQFAKRETDKTKSNQQKMNFFGKAKTSPSKKTPVLKDAANKKIETVEGKKSDSKAKKTGVAAFLSETKTDPFSKRQKSVKKEPEAVKNSVPEVSVNKKTSSKKKDEAVSKIKDNKEGASLDTSEKGGKIEEKRVKTSSKRRFDDDVLKIDNFSDGEDEHWTLSLDKPEKGGKIEEKRVNKGASLDTSEKGGKIEEKKAKTSKRRFEDDDLKIDNFSDGEDDFAVEKVKKSKKNVENKKNGTKKSAKTQQKKTETQVKKRRRIQELSSSESEEEVDEMDVIPPSPPAPKMENPHPAENGGSKGMKKVVKTKTYIDEEGFMVTEKESVLEECDEPEPVTDGNKTKHQNKPEISEAEPKKNKIPASSTAVQPKGKKKQASIMGFFTRK